MLAEPSCTGARLPVMGVVRDSALMAALQMPPEIVTGLFTLAGVCAGGLIGFWSARHIGWLNARAAAASGLRAAFGPHLYGLDIEADRTAGMLLKGLIEDFPRHARQMGAFGFFISSKEKPDYEKACQEYADLVRLHQNPNHPDTPPRVFRGHIRVILDFAKP